MAVKGAGCVYYSTVGGADNATLSSTNAKLFGAIVNGSAGGCTLSIYDGSGGSLAAIIHASTLASSFFSLMAPAALSSGLATTASGTGSYSVFYSL